jgi:hypothetical protein
MGMQHEVLIFRPPDFREAVRRYLGRLWRNQEEARIIMESSYSPTPKNTSISDQEELPCIVDRH